MNKTTTAERLQYLMSERDLKQIDILRAVEPYSQKYGIKFHRSDISQYVSGKVEPGQEKLKILGLALNVSPVWLMGYDVPMIQQLEEESHFLSDASESELLRLYRAVNPDGQSYILSTARLVAGNPAMQKEPSSGRAI